MSRSNRGPPFPTKGTPHGGMPLPAHEHSPYGRGLGPMSRHHPALLDEMREGQFGMNARPFPPHPAIFEERLIAQHQEIEGLLADNQRFAATHLAIKQELEASQHELQRMANFAESLRAEKDSQMREMYEKSVRLEVDLRGVEAMRAEIVHVHADIKELTNVRQELTGQVQVMTQYFTRMTTDLHQVPAMKAEIESVRQELQQMSSAIGYEKKGYAENYEHGQTMEKNLISMARELEKLRTEIVNAEKRASVAAVVPNPGAGYNVNYGNPKAGYVGNPYPTSYNMNQVQPGADGIAQYGHGPAWGAYDMQRAQGHK